MPLSAEDAEAAAQAVERDARARIREADAVAREAIARAESIKQEVAAVTSQLEAMRAQGQAAAAATLTTVPSRAPQRVNPPAFDQHHAAGWFRVLVCGGARPSVVV